ncbi:hypothetical protein [Azospirillum sp. TSO22-1]|uniref:hypothetical protein n=1 Tax=Azospirillum sp. TSO22-1 TaxID=716789 RepID=UPI000D6185B5|nr:hypothetical protein [Azospirillum sp. TSO22-1]PWC53614.1 hypothetical protein TSO221_10320 [Azospirillum sp. TSO22-1]
MSNRARRLALLEAATRPRDPARLMPDLGGLSDEERQRLREIAERLQHGGELTPDEAAEIAAMEPKVRWTDTTRRTA